MGGTPQAPTIQNAISDPNFWKLSVDDRVSVLSHIDSNFRGLKPETQLEVMQHLGERAGTPPTVGPQTEGFPVGASPSMPMAPSGSQTAAGIQGRELLRTAAPYAGATAASLLAGPEAGVLARMGLAAAGGAAGQAASHAVPGGTQPPLFSAAGAKEVGLSAVEQAAYELGGAVLGKVPKFIAGRLAGRVPVEEAASKVASTLGPDLTPAEFGDQLRATISSTRSTLGAFKRSELDNIVQQFPIGTAQSAPGAAAMPLKLDNVNVALNKSISDLEAQRNLAPSLFAAGEKNARTLAVLNDLKDSISQGKIATLTDLDNLRSNLFKMGQGIDRPLPKRAINSLTSAVHTDIGESLGQFGAPGNAAFQRYEQASGAFRDVADAMETSTLKRVMKSNVMQPEKVFQTLMNAPEGNLQDLGAILDKAPNGSAIRASVKNLALNRAASDPNLLQSIPESARPVIFGADLPKVQKFFDLVSAPSAGELSMIQKAGVHAAGVVGGFAAGEALGHPILGLGAGEAAARWIIRGGNEARTISGPELATLLGNPRARDLLLRAAQTSASDKGSALLLRGIGTYLETPSQPAVPTGATIGEQLKSKGQAPPQ